MPTVQFDSPLQRQKIALAKEYGNRVKEVSLGYNRQVEAIWRRWLSLIKITLSRGEDIEVMVDTLLQQMRSLLEEVLGVCIDLALERETESETEKMLYALMPLEVEQCNIGYYDQTLDKYKGILTMEILLAQELGFTDELELFLYNPMSFMADKGDGMARLKDEVDGGQGVSYSFFENMKKLGISAAALSYSNALHHIWENKGTTQWYYGVRNSNYPCALCDSYAYVLQPMDAGMIYPLHNRCVCSIVPVNQSEIL